MLASAKVGHLIILLFVLLQPAWLSYMNLQVVKNDFPCPYSHEKHSNTDESLCSMFTVTMTGHFSCYCGLGGPCKHAQILLE